MRGRSTKAVFFTGPPSKRWRRHCRPPTSGRTLPTGCGDLALAGGVFANVKLNQRIHELKSVRSLFVHPGMGDEGLALGAAFALAGAGSENTVRPEKLSDVYFGPEYGEREK